MSDFISLSQAVDMTTLYRTEKDHILKSEYQGLNILCNCETFDRSQFDELLAKPDCKSLRIYYGMEPSLKIHAIIVAVNDKNENILPDGGAAMMTTSGGDIIEEGKRCPDDCPPPSPLG
jgi:hypothetical protein